MANYNRVVLCGNLVKKPEIRYTTGGTAVGGFTIAINRESTKDGVKKSEVSFIPIVVWGKTAENCEKYLDKGKPALLEGRLQQQSWVSKDGEKKTRLEVVADSVQFLGQATTNNQPAGRTEEVADMFEGESMDDVPF